MAEVQRVPAIVGDPNSPGVRHAEIPPGAVAPNVRHAEIPEGAIPWDQSLIHDPHCKGVKQNGEACKANPLKGEDWCVFHAPEGVQAKHDDLPDWNRTYFK